MREVKGILRMMKGYSRNTAVYNAWRPTRHSKASQRALGKCDCLRMFGATPVVGKNV